jgi:hypothetical protein
MSAGHWWLTPVILPTLKEGSGGSQFKAPPRQIVPYLKSTQCKKGMAGTGRVAQVGEHLLSKPKTLSSNQYHQKKGNKCLIKFFLIYSNPVTIYSNSGLIF